MSLISLIILVVILAGAAIYLINNKDEKDDKTIQQFLNGKIIKETGSKQNSQDELHTVVSNEREVTDISDPYMIVDENVPGFSEDEITTESFEHYSELDALGRCGVATACIGTDLMPTEKRGNISRVKPTGWHSIQYDSVEGKSLYNRCHLIAHQLAGEDANEKNLITGTRYMNVSGMLPFEEEVGDYVRETGNHVMYRVTPVFEGDNLLADGVQMEAYSVEDQGKGVSYNVYIFNAQPGIWIDYATGESREIQPDDMVSKEDASDFVLNTNTKKFHLPSCGNADKIQKENKENFTGDRQQLVKNGYEPCGSCNP